jgi:hypothetical protein
LGCLRDTGRVACDRAASKPGEGKARRSAHPPASIKLRTLALRVNQHTFTQPTECKESTTDPPTKCSEVGGIHPAHRTEKPGAEPDSTSMPTCVSRPDIKNNSRDCAATWLVFSISNDRLSCLPDGRVSLRLKTSFKDGTSHLVLTPHAFIEHLCALIPRPRSHRVRYHGVGGPASPMIGDGDGNGYGDEAG